MNRKEVEREYRDNTGKEPTERFPDDPAWRYTGSPKEKEQLLKDLGIEADRDVKQETLF